MEIRQVVQNVHTLLQERWAVISAGSLKDFNCMTIAWGTIGVLWVKPIITVYIKPSRHTYGYIEKNEYFGISFFEEQYKPDLIVLGTKSGRNCNKIAGTKLTPRETNNIVTYDEAKITFVCRKIYAQDIEVNKVPEEVRQKYYEVEVPHRMYIGEIVGDIENDMLNKSAKGDQL